MRVWYGDRQEGPTGTPGEIVSRLDMAPDFTYANNPKAPKITIQTATSVLLKRARAFNIRFSHAGGVAKIVRHKTAITNENLAAIDPDRITQKPTAKKLAHSQRNCPDVMSLISVRRASNLSLMA